LNDGIGGENLLNSSESDSSLIRNSSTGTGSFEAAAWVGTLFGKTWMNNHLTPGQQYTLSYKVTCLSRPTGTFTGTETRPMPILVHQGRGMSQSTSVIGGTNTTDIPEGESRIFITNFTFATISESNEYYGLCLYTMLFKASSGTQYATFRISNFKLEEGSVATPWIPNPNDALYSTLGLNDGVVYDCSGYRHDGSIVNTTSVTSDAPRYKVTTYFNSGAYVRIDNIQSGNLENSYTMTYWAKIANGKIPCGYRDSNRLNIYITNGLICCNTGDGNQNPFQLNGASINVEQYYNEWHHYAMSGDGFESKLYIDGEYKGSAKTYRPMTGTHFVINGWDFNTSYKINYISDVRIYATVLSAEDIKSLYETAASIDDHGNVYGYELEEV
jgi:hypothetical protein